MFLSHVKCISKVVEMIIFVETIEVDEVWSVAEIICGVTADHIHDDDHIDVTHNEANKNL